jgi:hypothetical protein
MKRDETVFKQRCEAAQNYINAHVRKHYLPPSIRTWCNAIGITYGDQPRAIMRELIRRGTMRVIRAPGELPRYVPTWLVLGVDRMKEENN